MNTNSKAYTGIDCFRFMAALLIIAIHTSPLLSYSEAWDLILTRIIARVSVPFFLMTSGFFLISRYSCNSDKLKEFVKKTGIIYGISILIYIPLNIYNGYFTMDNLLPNIIKDILFDGTLYHLWYLPASIIGGIIGWFLVKKEGLRKALIITLVLYVIGLFGDSYYGIGEKIPLLRGLYSYMFQISDYTRNGIFFAPVFFVLGAVIADKTIGISLRNSIAGFGISFLLMCGEGILVHRLGLQRHDSMYIFLIGCMYFLFSALTFWRGRRSVTLRTLALIIYIIHPMMIVVIRMTAKVLKKLLIENSIVHYLAVSVTSVAFSVLAMVVIYRAGLKKAKFCVRNKDRAWIEIDLNNLKHNVRVLKGAMPKGCDFMAVVKARAYGHGAFEISTCINRIGVRAFAVATIDEGIELRRYGIQGEILILGYTSPARAGELNKYNLMQTLIDYEYAILLNRQGYGIKAHIKINTGMNRLGFDSTDVENATAVFSMENIEICGIYTHLCVSDSLTARDVSFTNMQITSFYKFLDALKENGIKVPKIHIQSSYGLLNYPELKCNYIRVGICLYGVLSSPNDKTKLNLDLRHVFSLKSQIVLLRKIPKGESVGYGRTFTASKDILTAVLPVGYGDGLPRNLSCGNGHVIIRGRRVPVIGRICMDQMIIDVTEVEGVAVGDTVTLIGKEGNEELSASDLAENSETITNELLSRMGARLKIITRG